MRAKKLVTTIVFLFSVSVASAQTSVSFMHLGDATFQNSYLYPSLIPKGEIFVGLPVLSGVHFHVNSKTSYNETFSKSEGSVLLDIDKMLPNLQKHNLTSVHANVNLLHFGYRFENGASISLMANERLEADILYSKMLVDLVWNGNEQFAGQDIEVEDAGVVATHFREIGVGYAMPLNERIDFGVRGKLLVGFLNFSTPNNFDATLNTSSEAFQLTAEWENFAIQRSGIDIYSGNEGNLGSHLLFNKNLGGALDFGATIKLSRSYTISASLLDVGFIGWKENINSRTLNDTTFSYDGVDLEDLGALRQTLEDSVVAAFRTQENFDNYTEWLPIKANVSWAYHFRPKTDIYISGGARYIQRKVKMLYGAGVTQKIGRNFVGSVSVTKLPQQFFNLGAAFAVNGGPVQFYMAADQVINFSVPDAKSFDFRLGMNFMFGRNKELLGGQPNKQRIDTKAKGISTHEFLGSRVKTKKRQGIYSIIKKQRKRKVDTAPSKKKKKVNNTSLNGKKGRKNTSSD